MISIILKSHLRFDNDRLQDNGSDFASNLSTGIGSNTIQTQLFVNEAQLVRA